MYLVMNRRRHFWKHFGIAAAASAAAFGICFLVSFASGGRLARTTLALLEELTMGYYDGVVYWLTLWLAFTATIISAQGMAEAFIEQRAQAQRLQLKNEMIADNYHLLEEKIAETAALRHEFRHQLTAMDCLYQKNDTEGARRLLSQILQEQNDQTPMVFTKNHTINTILHDAAARAKQQRISFQASVSVPEDLPIPDADLCSLLMNMLDNALEGAAKVSPNKDRRLSIQIKVVNQYLAVKCKNSFNGTWKEDKDGNLLTTKENAASHGFGCRQMKKIAEKYDSTILFHSESDAVFLVETALKFPQT